MFASSAWRNGALPRKRAKAWYASSPTTRWLDGLSFTGMRERYLESFDTVRIDCLNGDKYKTGKVAPDGSPDPSIFSTEGGSGWYSRSALRLRRWCARRTTNLPVR